MANIDDPFKALVFDSNFDHYRGVVANIAVFGGRVKKGDKVVSAHLGKTYEVNELGLLRPDEQPTQKLYVFCFILSFVLIFMCPSSDIEMKLLVIFSLLIIDWFSGALHFIKSLSLSTATLVQVAAARLFWDGLLCRFAGQVGYIIAGMKNVKEAQIGDTLYMQGQPVEALPGFKPAKAMVFAGKKWPCLLLALCYHIYILQIEI